MAITLYAASVLIGFGAAGELCSLCLFRCATDRFSFMCTVINNGQKLHMFVLFYIVVHSVRFCFADVQHFVIYLNNQFFKN